MLTYAFAGQTLNNIMQTLNIFSDSAMVFRVMANVNQYNGSASTMPATYTPAVSVSVTPYTTNLFVPGAYQGWNPATAPVLNPVPGRPGIFEGYVDITGSGIQYFKYTNAPDWNHTNYGDGEDGTLSTNGAAAGLSVPSGGVLRTDGQSQYQYLDGHRDDLEHYRRCYAGRLEYGYPDDL